MRNFQSATPANTLSHTTDVELEQRVNESRERSAYELSGPSAAAGIVAAVGVLVILYERVPAHLLWPWFAARVILSLGRLAQSHFALNSSRPHAPRTFLIYRLLALTDGAVWGSLGWFLTPVQVLEIAIVTLGVGIAVSALGTLMLHVDLPSAALFVSPILLPNALHALSRHDDLGVFCALAFVGLMGLLLLESQRASVRLVELLRLRFQSERVTQAQAQALDQARLLSEAKSRFVATMSHEMRTPLHGMLGLVRLLREREQDPKALHQLDLVRSSGDHLVHVINDVLDFSRMEAGSLPLHREAFKLHALLQEVAETCQIMAQDKGLTMDIHLALHPDKLVFGDPVRIRQVLHNLLGNAVKFTPQGQVNLRAWLDEAQNNVTVEVHDSGIGIPPQELGRVFDAFHQAEGTYQRRFGGTGLGLTISRELCRAMGGDLSCSSTEGQGSVFTFTLPLPMVMRQDAAPNSPSAAQDSTASQADHLMPFTHEPHVLLVEDNPVNAIVAEAELERLGAIVTVISNGREAVEWLTQHQADLVLMDCEMPVLDGFEATRQIRSLEQRLGRSAISIVALTANGRDMYLDKGVSAGMNDYISKPFSTADLVRVLNKHLRLECCPS